MPTIDPEFVGKKADTIDSLLGAMALPLPPKMHLDGLKASLTSMRDELRAEVVRATGENPWENHPS